MSLRIKAALIIMAIVLVVAAMSLITNFLFTSQNITDAADQDMALALDFADNLVSTKMQLIKANGATVAERLLQTDSPGEMTEIMALEIAKFPEFRALSVFDQNLGVIANCGVPIKSAELLEESRYVQMAYNGESVISTTHYDPETNDFIMHVFVPMTSNMALVATIPGFIFSDFIGSYKVWKTGFILILDEEGTIIAERIRESVSRRLNPIMEAKANPEDKEVQSWGEMTAQILSTEAGDGSFFNNGTEFICTYKRLTGTTAGWHILVVAPVKENPRAGLWLDLMYSTVFFLIVGILVSILVSPIVTKPLKKIEEQSVKIHQRDMLLNTVNNTAAILLKSEPDDFERDLRLCMSMVAEAMDLDRVYIWKNYVKNGKTHAAQLYEWYNGVEPQHNDAQASLVLPVFLRDDIWGNIGYDDCHNERVFTENEQSILSSAGNVITYAVFQNEMTKNILASAAQLETALKETREANSAKSDFLARMSHEMRTPLNAIIGLSELSLEIEGVSEELYANLEKVCEAGKFLLSTVNDILDISKIEAGKLELVPNRYSIPSLFNDTITQNMLRIGEKPIKFVLDIDQSLPAELYGDDLRIKQILNNLLSNAFKYTKKGTVELSVKSSVDTLYPMEGDSVWLTFKVRDSGIGIRPGETGKLFTDYSQMDINVNHKIEGTGLGLSITRKIAEMMGGSISVESEYGKGSVFTVVIKQQYIDDSV
ncbi:MAG: ATP-binding protein, partial [Treponema sp.]|nr:ATP-binding protein [Treponema sp.]